MLSSRGVLANCLELTWFGLDIEDSGVLCASVILVQWQEL